MTEATWNTIPDHKPAVKETINMNIILHLIERLNSATGLECAVTARKHATGYLHLEVTAPDLPNYHFSKIVVTGEHLKVSEHDQVELFVEWVADKINEVSVKAG